MLNPTFKVRTTSAPAEPIDPIEELLRIVGEDPAKFSDAKKAQSGGQAPPPWPALTDRRRGPGAGA